MMGVYNVLIKQTRTMYDGFWFYTVFENLEELKMERKIIMNAKKKLGKDLLTAVLGFGIMFLLATAGGSDSGDVFFCILCSGVVFGWQLMSHVFIATGLWSVFIKLILSVIVGLPALPIILVADVLAVIREYYFKGNVEE